MSVKIKMRKHNLCHRCLHNMKGDPACLTCRDPAITAHRGAVSLDALVEIGKEPCVEPTDAYDDDDDRAEVANTMQRNRIDDLILVITTFFALTTEQFAVVRELYADKKETGFATYRNAAAKLGIDRHAVADMLAGALEACPALAALNLQFKPTSNIRLPDGEPCDADTPDTYRND